MANPSRYLLANCLKGSKGYLLKLKAETMFVVSWLVYVTFGGVTHGRFKVKTVSWHTIKTSTLDCMNEGFLR